jgi:ribonuclease P protein component
MVLHYLPQRPVVSAGAGSSTPPPGTGPRGATVSPRVGLVVGRAVGNSVVRHRVTRRLRAAARAELHRLPPTADLVLRARPEAATAAYARLRGDLAAGLDRLLGTGESR